jgi:hypothetical protein
VFIPAIISWKTILKHFETDRLNVKTVELLEEVVARQTRFQGNAQTQQKCFLLVVPEACNNSTLIVARIRLSKQGNNRNKTDTTLHKIADQMIGWRDSDERRQFQRMEWVSECTLSQESLWLWSGDSYGTQEGERPPLEAGTRGVMRHSKPRGFSACAYWTIECEK